MHDSVPFRPIVRFWLTFFALSVICYLGGLGMRTIAGNEFFITGTLQFSSDVSLDQERTLFQMIYASNFIVLISYACVLLSAIMLLVTLPLKIKDNGWLLLASMLFFLFVPVEVFTGYLDVKFILFWSKVQNHLTDQGLHIYEQYSTLLRETLSHRIGALGGMPVIAVLCYITAIVVIIWQPMRRRPAAASPSTGSEGTDGSEGTEGSTGTEGSIGTEGPSGTEGSTGTEGSSGTEGGE